MEAGGVDRLKPRRSRHYPSEDRERGTPGSESHLGVGLACAARLGAVALHKVALFLANRSAPRSSSTPRNKMQAISAAKIWEEVGGGGGS
jgi:hypothetical protein